MISSHISIVKPNFYNFIYVHRKAQKMNITLLYTIKPKPNPSLF